jgi:hypothetical protein
MTLLPSSLRPATSTSFQACTLAVADMMAWMRLILASLWAEDHVPCGVGPDKAGCVRGFGHHVQVPKIFSPKKYKIRVSKMYELSSSRHVGHVARYGWLRDRGWIFP